MHLMYVAMLLTFHGEVRMGLVVASDHLHTVQPNMQILRTVPDA